MKLETILNGLKKVKEGFVEDLSELRCEARVGSESEWKAQQQYKAWRGHIALIFFVISKELSIAGEIKNMECCLCFLWKMVRATTSTGVVSSRL